ncbi:hypothetical protein YC2023_118928 [Brassica napus]
MVQTNSEGITTHVSSEEQELFKVVENPNAVSLKGDFEGHFEADFRRFSLIHRSHRWLSLRRYHRRSHHRSHSRFLYIRYERKPKRAFSQRHLVELRRRVKVLMGRTQEGRACRRIKVQMCAQMLVPRKIRLQNPAFSTRPSIFCISIFKLLLLNLHCDVSIIIKSAYDISSCLHVFKEMGGFLDTCHHFFNANYNMRSWFLGDEKRNPIILSPLNSYGGSNQYFPLSPLQLRFLTSLLN